MTLNRFFDNQKVIAIARMKVANRNRFLGYCNLRRIRSELFIVTRLPMDKELELKKPAEYGRLLAEYISTFILLPVSAWQSRCQDR